MAAVKTVGFSSYLGFHGSAASLGPKCFSSDPDNYLLCGDLDPCFTPPLSEGRSILTNTLVFLLVPSSYQVLYKLLYILTVARYSCPFSAGV